MSIPAAIVIAGVVIAGAVYFSRVGPKEGATPVANQAAQPTPREASLDIRPISGDDHIRGSEDAAVTIVEYSDFECPYCKVFHQGMIQLLADYPGQIRWVYRHAPIQQLHAKAFAEANASECAAAQGKFWEFSDVVFATTTSNDGLNLADMPNLARQAGVADIATFESCVASNEFQEKIEAQLQDGKNAGLQGTPFNMIITSDGEKTQLGGGIPYPQLKETVEPLL